MNIFLPVNKDTGEVDYQATEFMHREDPNDLTEYGLVNGWEYREFEIKPVSKRLTKKEAEAIIEKLKPY